MSGEERSKSGGGGAADEGPTNPKEKRCPGCEKKPRNFSLFRLRKMKWRGFGVNSGCWWRRAPGGTPGGESPTSDPNSSGFTSERLRAIIEKSDFYSRECNPHLNGWR